MIYADPKEFRKEVVELSDSHKVSLWEALCHVMNKHKLEPETVKIMVTGSLKKRLEEELRTSRMLKAA